MVLRPMVRRSVRTPLESKLLPTGYTGLRAEVELQVRTRLHRYAVLLFTVDPGSNVTTIPVSVAKDYELFLPEKSIPCQIKTATGLAIRQVRAALITVRVPGLDGRDFMWPCHFVDAAAGDDLNPLLGLGGVLNDLRIIFDGTYAQEAPYGRLILEELLSRAAP